MSTRSAKSPAPAERQLPQRPGFLVRRLHQIHLALFAEECAAFEVTPVQYSIMTVVGEQPGLEQARLAYEVGIDRTTLANVVARLEGRGVLKRGASPTDGRVRLVKLTAKGKRLLDKMREAVRRAHERTIDALPPKERKLFVELLRRLVDAGNEYGRAPLRLE